MKYLWLVCLFSIGCSKIKEGKVSFVGFIPPHYRPHTYYVNVGKSITPVTQEIWIPDTEWVIQFKSQQKTREIFVSREDAYNYIIGDSIYLK